MANKNKKQQARQPQQPQKEFEGVKPRTQGQKELVHAINSSQVVICLGPAGTGKTHISVAMAVQAVQEGRVKRIIITRPMVTAGESMGFLPGDMEDKINPFLYPIENEFCNVLPGGKGQFNKWKHDGTIEILPIAFMRGTSLRSSFIIVDEAQNATYEQHKMILTRLCEDSCIVVNGDEKQSDLKDRGSFGRFVTDIKRAPSVKVVRMGTEDIVRSRIVREILEVLEENP